MIVVSGYNRKCKSTQGGIVKAYLMPFVPYGRLSLIDRGMNLISHPQQTIYPFEVQGSYQTNTTLEAGAWSVNQQVTLELPVGYDLAEFDIHSFLKQEYKVIVETNNKQTIMFGTRNGLDAQISNGSGSDKQGFNGFSMNFTGMEEKFGLFIANLDDFFTQAPTNLLNADLNFTI